MLISQGRVNCRGLSAAGAAQSCTGIAILQQQR